MKDLRKCHPNTSGPPTLIRSTVCMKEEVDRQIERFKRMDMSLIKKSVCHNVERGKPGYRLIFKSNE